MSVSLKQFVIKHESKAYWRITFGKPAAKSTQSRDDRGTPALFLVKLERPLLD